MSDTYPNLDQPWPHPVPPSSATDAHGSELAAVPGSPIRVTLSRRKGWRIPANTVIVSRPSRWGNPFWKGHGCRMSAAWSYECAVLNAQRLDAMGRRRGGWHHFRWIARHLDELRGKNLACWCPADMPHSYCHAGVLLRLANAEVSDAARHCAELPNSERGGVREH